jgi:hypothetical protein
MFADKLIAGDAIRRIKSAIECGDRVLGSGLVDHSQKMMVAARAMAERKTVGHRS